MADLSLTMVEHFQVTCTKHLSFTFLSFQIFGQRNLLITGNYGCPNILVIFKHRISCLLFIYEWLLFSLIL